MRLRGRFRRSLKSYIDRAVGRYGDRDAPTFMILRLDMRCRFIHRMQGRERGLHGVSSQHREMYRILKSTTARDDVVS